MSDWLAEFRQQVQSAKAANQGAGAASSPPPSSGSQGISPATAPAPGSQSADTAQYFAKLLEDVAMDPVAAVELGKFIAAKFSDEQRKRAEAGLRELGSQQDTVKRLTLAYEKAEGKLLPRAGDDEEELPF